jgi:hypothetical protein
MARLVRFELVAGRGPGVNAAVENRHPFVPQVVQHPPQSSGGRPAGVVIYHHEVLTADACCF